MKEFNLTVGPGASPEFILAMERRFRKSVTRISLDDAERASFTICSYLTDPTPFKDNVETVCADCGIGIRHRPHCPRTPPKLCFRCVAKRISSDA